MEISGTKDDEWVAIHFNNIMVNCFIEEARNEYSIEERLKNKTTPEEIAEFEKIGSLKKKKRPFEPLYRFWLSFTFSSSLVIISVKLKK